MTHMMTMWLLAYTVSNVIITCDANLITAIQLSTEMTVSNSVFKSTEHTDMPSCVYLCKIRPSCIIVNFRRHGNLCLMSHTNVAMDTVTVAKQNKPGVISWSKKTWNQTNDPGVAVCQINDPRHECKALCVNAGFFTPAGGTFYGNIIVEGSRIIYDTDVDPMQEAICQASGAWLLANDTSCIFAWFIEDTLSDGTEIKYRVCHEIVTISTAEARCKHNNAALLQITTEPKHSYFIDLLFQPEYRGNYWFDARDVNGVWQTSDGQAIPTSVINEYDRNQECARLSLRRGYDGQNIYCTDKRKFSFICEVRE